MSWFHVEYFLLLIFTFCLDFSVVSLSVLKITSQSGSPEISFGFMKCDKGRMHVRSPSVFHL